MGLSISWIASKGHSRPDLLEALGLSESGPGYRCQPIPVPATFVVFEYGSWVFIASPHPALASRSRVRAASTGGRAVGAYLEEHIMISGAFAAEDGDLIWSVQHDPNIAPDHLDVWGKPPEVLEDIREKLTAEGLTQPDVDAIFDVPTELAAHLCNFDPNRFEFELDLTTLAITQPHLMHLRDPLLASAMTDPSGAAPEVRRRRQGLIARLFGLG